MKTKVDCLNACHGFEWEKLVTAKVVTAHARCHNLFSLPECLLLASMRNTYDPLLSQLFLMETSGKHADNEKKL